MMTEKYDAIVIGTGQSGPALAGRFNAEGMKTAVVERKLFGGTCVNVGCTPTKALVASARAAHMARRGADFGVRIGGDIQVDMAAVKTRMKEISGQSTQGVTRWLEGMENVTVIRGHARLESPTSVSVDGELLQSERIYLNVGGRALVPDMPGLAGIDYLTNSSAMELDAVPRHLIVVGGSYIGLEFGQIYRRFGAQVTIIQKGPRLINREDEDISDTVREVMEKEGIDVRLDAECLQFEKQGDGIAAGVSCAEGAPEIVGSHREAQRLDSHGPDPPPHGLRPRRLWPFVAALGPGPFRRFAPSLCDRPRG